MLYCAVEDVKTELHPSLLLAMEQAYQDSIDATIDSFLEQHITRAGNFVDVKLARVFKTPFKSLAPVILTITAKLAAYFAAAAHTEREDILNDKRDIAYQMLEDILEAGNIPGMEDEETSSPINSGVYSSSEQQYFTREELKKW